MKIIGKMGLALLVIAFLGLIVPGLEAATINVNCNTGESVQSALDNLTGPATIVVRGTCNENVVIKQDDVTLQGGTYIPFDSSQHTIRVLGARRVVMTGVTVTGGRNGIWVYQGGSLTLDGNSNISGATINGVVASYGSSATVNSSTIQGNVYGVTATDNSAIVLTNSTIKDNTGTGVLVVRSSSARIGLSIMGVSGPNKIKNNSGSGVSISRGAYAIVDGNKIADNSNHGVHIEGASATVTNNTIAHNQLKGIVVHNSGNARIGLTEGSEAGPNTIEKNNLEGIHSSEGGSAYIFKNTIQNNGISTHRPGVGIYRATAELIGDNTIQGNGGHGVAVNQGTLFQGKGDWNLTTGPDFITGNGYSGISGWNGASLDIRNLEVINNSQNGISLSLKSTLRIYDASVSGNQWNGIELYDGSSVARYIADSPRDSITGNLRWGIICHGGSSLVGGIGAEGVSGNTSGQVNCP